MVYFMDLFFLMVMLKRVSGPNFTELLEQKTLLDILFARVQFQATTAQESGHKGTQNVELWLVTL